MSKPHINRMTWIHGERLWRCGYGFAATNDCGYGWTAREAYRDWKSKQ